MPTPPTLAITINSLVALLQQRLGETTGIYWTPTELTLYIRQAIREFQVLTGFWRSRIQITTSANTPFYDLSSSDPQLAYTVTDFDILSQIGFHLLESGASPFVITSQFTQGTLTAAFDQRREEIFGDTRMVVSEFTDPVGSPVAGRVVLPSGVLQVHRADWQDSISGLWSRLERSDEIGGYGWQFGWPASPALPLAFSVGVTPPFTLQLIPPNANTGNLDLILTQCAPYAFIGSPQTLGVPDDATFALSWGILASILGQDSQSRDYARADYALARWNMALEILKTYPLVMQVGLGQSQIQPATMQGLDAWRPSWRNEAPAQPDTFAVVGRNMIALATTPNAAYNAEADCIVNSPASGSGSATISIPGDIVTALLDNGTHLACFKMGGDEFQATLGMYRNFTMVAQEYASRERAEAINFEALRDVTKYENAQMPFEVTA